MAATSSAGAGDVSACFSASSMTASVRCAVPMRWPDSGQWCYGADAKLVAQMQQPAYVGTVEHADDRAAVHYGRLIDFVFRQHLERVRNSAVDAREWLRSWISTDANNPRAPQIPNSQYLVAP